MKKRRENREAREAREKEFGFGDEGKKKLKLSNPNDAFGKTATEFNNALLPFGVSFFFLFFFCCRNSGLPSVKKSW